MYRDKKYFPNPCPPPRGPWAPACSRWLTRLAAVLACLVLLQPAAVHAGEPLRSGCEIDYPPFCIVDEQGRANGFSVELMRAALAAMDRGVVFRTGTWAEVRGWLERGEVQALPLVGRTPERESLFDFTFPYMSLHGAIVVRAGTKGIRGLDDLRGRRVAVMKGDNTEEFLRRENRGIEIHTTPSFEDALRELSEGRHDAVVIQRLVALRLIREAGLANLQVINRPIEEFRQDFCFAVREGDRETLALLNEGLAIVMADGTYRHLHHKWFAALELPAHRRIIVGGDHNYPPYEFLDENGRPTGFNVELTRAIAREVGLDIEIRLGPWAQIRRALARGEIDVIQGMLYSPQRDLVFDFTPPHTVNHCVAVVRRGEGPPPGSVQDLRDKRIVVQEGDIMYDFALENGLEDRITPVDTQEDALRQLAGGEHDCALAARLTALYWIDRYGWDNLVVGRQPLYSPEYCFAVPQNQHALLAQFSEGLKILDKTGEYRRIYEKWMGVYEEGPPDFAVILRYVAMGVVPLVLILLLSFTWAWSLRRQVARRTAALRESEQHFRNLADSGTALIWTSGTDANRDYFNRSWLDFTGRTLEEEAADGWIEGVHPADCVRCLETYSRAFDQRQRFSTTYRLRRYDGAYRWIREDGSPRYDSSGNFIGYIGHCLDITDFKLAQERIEHLNNVLRAIRDVNQLIVRERDPDVLIRQACRMLVDNRGYASVLIVLTDDTGRPVSWAEAGMGEAFSSLEAMLGQGRLPPCCQYARSVERAVRIEDRRAVCGNCPIVEKFADTSSLCVALVHGGTVFGYLAVALEPGIGEDEEEQGLFTEMADDIAYALSFRKSETARKVSEQKSRSLEDQLLQAQKLESVGRLAGGVAHDYNNMLSVIIGYTELAMEKVPSHDPLHADLGEILRAARRSVEITRQLLAFARKQTISPRPMDLNETVEGMLRMLRRLIGEDIDLSWQPGAGLWPVKMDPVQIDQILVNLCVNARDAISGVGKITIETENMVFDEAYCADHAGFAPGRFVMLAVSDDGCGMDRQTLESVFEPFFTTKEINQGTGLGLSTVYGIVKQNSGFVNVYSEPGKGTTFRIYLPRHEGGTQRPEARLEDEIPRGRGETVLLVEDEPSIMKMGQVMLEKLGYRVLAAGGPEEALELAGARPGSIDLLITDVVMPDMNGRELAARIGPLCPGMRTLFMSGYTANVIAHHGVLDSGVHFLEKPFSRQELAVRVREVLEA